MSYPLNYAHDGRCIWCDQQLPSAPMWVNQLSFCDETCAFEWAARYDETEAKLPFRDSVSMLLG